ncbi:MAG: hypothetical protein AAGD86_00270 [Pseudomonadota bacterium]
MTANRTPLRSLTAGCLLALMAGAPALADDTEIFVGNILDGSEPNVLLVLDTSGSMGTLVDTAPAFDPATVYPGECLEGVVYWREGSTTLPSCGNQWFDRAALTCDQMASALDANGFGWDRAARWDEDDRRWRSLDEDDKDSLVECEDDFGLHGDGIDASRVYPAERRNGPWTSNINARRVLDWDEEDTYVMATGNYLNYIVWSEEQFETLSRLDIMKESVNEILDGTNNINVGLMRFSTDGSGGQVLQPVAPIGEVRETVRGIVDGLVDGGVTPLSETMYEATRYLTGAPPYFGWYTNGNYGDFQPSVASSIDGNNYISPITNECQKNFVVLLTDGEPVSDGEVENVVPNLTGYTAATGQTSCSGNCLDEIAAYLHNHDLNDDLNERQSADVYTIGFFTDQQLLEDTADRGNGQYYTADNSSELLAAFTQIFEDIDRKDVTFTAPSVAINSFNRLTHRSELYFSMFRPDPGAHWPGNLKRYALGQDDGSTSILDATNAPAIDDDTGTFFESAKSFWTIGDPDGFDTTAGGLASRLLADRDVYTVTSLSTSNVALNTPANRVHEDNEEITEEMLEADNADHRYEILRWARGVDEEGNPLNILGDALHSQPVIASYGGSEENPDISLFYTTNDGYFHAVNPMADAGEPLEIFSFIPRSQLSRLDELAESDGPAPKSYGLDGPMTAWIEGDDGDGIVNGEESLNLYFGMRRGGRDYYAMDVTDRQNPRLKWMIKGGTGDFAELGQTWSKMIRGKVSLNGADRDVLLFGGGYDTNQDAAGESSTDDEGRAVYMIDADTGQRLWWAAYSGDNPDADLPLADMEHSIPSDLLVADINQDGYTDRIYFGDMGGKVWRMDIDNYENTGADDLVTGGVIGDFGGEGAAGNRRFYYAPSVSQVVSEDLGVFLSVSIGSGHRANPLGTPGKLVDDRFYMLRDPAVMQPAVDEDTGEAIYTVATEDDMFDVTDTLEPSTQQLEGYKGWMIRMDSNEKVLATPLTADGRVFFTSYVPGEGAEPTCNPTGATGSGRFYSVRVDTGGAIWTPEPPDGPGGEPPSDPPVGDPGCNYRCTPTTGPIPPEPVLIFQEPDEDAADPCDGFADVSLVVGTDIRNPGICTSPIRTYWFSQQDN